MKASSFIARAGELIVGERARQHGDKEENHTNIAALLEGYLGYSMEAEQAAIVLALMKIARTKTGVFNPDDYIDAIGYIAIAGEIAAEANQEITHVKYGRASEPEDGWVPGHGLVGSHHCAPEEQRDFVIKQYVPPEARVSQVLNGRLHDACSREPVLHDVRTED